MKLFPNKILTIEMRNDRLTTLSDLEQHTKLTDRLVSQYTDKAFIGHVSDSGFKIISSEIGRGALCVFEGELQDSFGHLEIRIHKAFKVLYSILMLLTIAVPVIASCINGILFSIEILTPMFIGILFIRIALIELSFRSISNTGLN